MSIVISIIATLIILGILIAVHEYGHYKAGRLLGFGIVEFSIGMGPTVFKREKNGIKYSLRALPIGGMCQFEGEDQEAQTPTSFNAMPAWKRLITVVAGPLMNIVLAIVLAIATVAIFGVNETVNYSKPFVSGFSENSIALNAGLAEGDLITAINGSEVEDTQDLINKVRASKGSSIRLTINRPDNDSYYTLNGKKIDIEDTEAIKQAMREQNGEYVLKLENGETLDITVNGVKGEGDKRLIGVVLTEGYGVSMRYSFFRTIGEGFDYLGTIFKAMGDFFVNLFSGNVSLNDMAGVVGIVDVVNTGVDDVIDLDATQISGWEKTGYVFEMMFYLCVLLSVNLGIVNMLPFPALDGGRTVFILFEMITKKRIPEKVEGIINMIGLGLLLVLIFVITGNDIIKLFTR